jgi:predicted component of type VI protein secretion system
MRHILIAALSGFIALSTPAFAQTDADMNKRLDETEGEHKPFAEFFAKRQKAVAAEDKAAVAAMVNYPLLSHSNAGSVQIKDAKHFLADYDKLITAKVKTAVAKQTYATLFTNWQGVMIGDGEIWFDQVGDSLEVKVYAINN